MFMIYDIGGICCARERTGDGRGTGVLGLCIRHETRNPLEKSFLLSPKTHELFGQLGNYVVVIILHVEEYDRSGDISR